MATGSGKNGSNINVGDEVTTSGTVTAISGTGSKATVTIVTPFGDTVVSQANDCYGPQTDGPALSICGKGFSVGDNVSLMGVVTAISGTGQSAKLTTAHKSSGLTATHTANASAAPKKN
jgi:hypothetical protein